MPRGVYIRTEETRKKRSILAKEKGFKPPSRLGIPNSEEQKNKISKAMTGFKRSPENRENMRKSRLGEKSHLWEGGKTSQAMKIRNSLEYRLWRESVFKRDNWTCIWCGKRGGKLNADHIKPFSLFPELRFAIDNGRTLCLDCHKITDTFGGKIKKISP